MKGFRKFLMRGNIVDLAVAIAVGTAFTAVVTSLVKDLFTPLIAAIAGKHDFSSLTFQLHNSTFRYGDFINAVISFLLIATAIYFVVVVPLRRLKARRGEVEEEPQTDNELLSEIRDLLRDRRS